MLLFLFIIASVSLLISFFLFDKILKFQYKNYRNIWEKDGKSGGFFWNAPESKFFSVSLSRTVRLLSWTFGNDNWMKNEPIIIKTAWLMRRCVFLFWIVAISSFIFLNISK